MTQGVGFLVKIFSNDSFRDDFLKGHLYMNPLKYFMEYEDEHLGNVGDKNEGISAWLQPEEIKINIKFGDQEIEIPGSDLAAPITLRRNMFNSVNVFCLMALHSHGLSVEQEISAEDAELLREYFTVPDDAANLGEYAVVIYDVNGFLSRVKKAAKQLVDSNEANYLQAQFVKYYDERSSLSLTNEMDAIFHKQKSYEHQKEFRICLDRGAGNVSPYVLKIGNLSDIAMPVLTKDISSMFNLEITPSVG